MSSSVRRRASSSSRAGLAASSGVGVDDLERRVAGQPHELAIAAQRRQAQVAAALLRRAHQRALAAQVEVDLGQLEAVGRRHQRLDPRARRGRRRRARRVTSQHCDSWAPRPTRPRSWCSWAMPKRSASRIDHHRRVRHVDADLDDGRRHEHVEVAGAERRPSSPPCRPTSSARAAGRGAARRARRPTAARRSPRPRRPPASRSPRSAGTRRTPGGRRRPRRARHAHASASSSGPAAQRVTIGVRPGGSSSSTLTSRSP